MTDEGQRAAKEEQPTTGRLPRRTRAHVLETLSRQYVESIFPPEWVCHRIEDDYGRRGASVE